MNQHQFSLPYPPSLNTYWRHVVVKGRVRVLISAKGRAYRQAVLSDLRVRKASPLGAARLKVTIQAFPPDRRARDLDNIPKAVLDALTHAGIYDDDSQIDHIVIMRGHVYKGGSVYVILEVLP